MKWCFVLAAFFIFALYFESTSASDEDECPEIRPVGCFRDRSARNRALRRLMITDRDRFSSKYQGKDIDWLNYKEYVEDLACRCAKEARKNGYSHFGLQYYGECWSGPNARNTFNKWGKSKKCINEYFGKCEDPEEASCIGKAATNFIYELTEEPEQSGSASGEQTLELLKTLNY